MDFVTCQTAINAALDVIWPLLPPEVLNNLSYV